MAAHEMTTHRYTCHEKCVVFDRRSKIALRFFDINADANEYYVYEEKNGFSHERPVKV